MGRRSRRADYHPKHVDGERYVGEVVEIVAEDAAAALRENGGASGIGGGVGVTGGVAEKDGTRIHWNRVVHRDHDGEFHLAYEHPDLGDDRERRDLGLFHRIADATDRPVGEVEAEYRRKYRYVQYMIDRGLDDFDELSAFLADLRNDEAATVERIGEG